MTVLTTPHRWLHYLLAMTPVCALYLLDVGPFGRGPVMNLIGASAVVAIAVGIKRNKPDTKLAWVMIAAGQALFVLGDLIAYNYDRFFGTELPYPSIADVSYLAVYPCLVTGLLILVRKRTPEADTPALIDSLIITTGLGVISWRFLMAPYAQDTTLGVPTKLISIAYPIMDVLILAVVARLAFGGGKRGVSFHLLVLSFIALLVTDAVFGGIVLAGGYETGGTLDLGWMMFYLLLGAAALHPSMHALSEPAGESDLRLTRWRLGVMAAASIAAPVTKGALLMLGDASETLVFVSSSIAVFLLVVWRMSGLIRRNERSADRERALRQAGAKLVAATNTDQIHAAAIRATVALAGPGAVVALADEPSADGAPIVAASWGGGGTLIGLPPTGESGIEANPSTCEQIPVPLARCGWLFAAPLATTRSSNGVLLVGLAAAPSSSVRAALAVLAAEVALALEGIKLTEDLHRRQSEARFASLVQNSSDMLAVIGNDTVIRYMSPSAARVLGYQPEQLEGTLFSRLVNPADIPAFLTLIERTSPERSESIECRMRRADGTWAFAETVRTNLLDDPNVGGIVLNTRDISDRKAFEEQLERQAFTDAITGLANRSLLRDRTDHALRRQGRLDRSVAVMFADLDDFKTVNDSLGHAAGDELLVEVAERLQGCLRSSDTAARLGGDEFVVLLEDRDRADDAMRVAERILDALKLPFSIGGRDLFISASIGIAFSDEDLRADSVDELLRNADVAMYTAKQMGKGRARIFEPAMHEAVVRRLELKADLQRAVENHEFEVHYQPILSLRSARIVGMEALVRWRHPERGLVHPGEFIPLAEETGLIMEIGDQVLRKAVEQAAGIVHRLGDENTPTLSINLSARQLQASRMVETVRRCLRATGLRPSKLTLEITESAMMDDPDVVELKLRALKALGVVLAVDDFGTGYSSLNYIRRFPVDVLKIDRSFVEGIATDPEVRSLAKTILDLARALNLRAVAEGIETNEQRAVLQQLGCEHGQGFLFARPLSADALEQLLQAQAVKSAIA